MPIEFSDDFLDNPTEEGASVEVWEQLTGEGYSIPNNIVDKSGYLLSVQSIIED